MEGPPHQFGVPHRALWVRAREQLLRSLPEVVNKAFYGRFAERVGQGGEVNASFVEVAVESVGGGAGRRTTLFVPEY